MTDRKLLQMALDVMLAAIKAGDWKVDGACDPDYVFEALRARLAQPEPKPDAWIMFDRDGDGYYLLLEPPTREDKISSEAVPVYKTPQREWVGLTDEEVAQIVVEYGDDGVAVAQATEAKLKEKNNGGD